jgi:CRISPR/Cas system-associated exonuclease Cas4 (RecB family)
MSVAPWSFSRLKSFEQCPKQFYHMKIAKDYTEAETDAMRYGTEAHLVAEEYIRDGKPVPAKFAYMKDVLEALNRRRGNKTTEIKMGLTVDLEPCKFRAKDVWWRGIADLVITDGSTAWIVDYKTGKSAKYADKGQLELMALATFKFFPEIKSINAALIFTKAKKFIKHKYTDDMIDSLWDKWLSKFKRMEVAYETDTWNAHPSGLCKRHCAVLECVYNGSN